MKMQASKILRYTIYALLAAVLLYFCFREISWKEFWSVLSGSNWFFVALAMVSGMLAAFVRSLRWRLLVKPMDPSIGPLVFFDAFNIAKLADFLIPHSAEFIRGGIVVGHSKPDPANPERKMASYDKLLGTVVLERAWDILMLAVLIVAVLVFNWTLFGGFFREKIWEPSIGRLGINPLWLIPAAIVLLGGIILAVRRVSFFKGMMDGFTSFLKMDSKILFLVYTALLWTFFLLMSFFIIEALPVNPGLGLVDALFIMLVGCVAGIVPVPGGFGAFHYLVALSLSTLYPISFEMGIVFATLSHESQAVVTAILGAVSYIHESFSKNSKG